MNELQKLITQMLEGRLSESEIERLEARLAQDPEARRIYVEQCHLHAQLSHNPLLKDLIKAEELIDTGNESNGGATEMARTGGGGYASHSKVIVASVAVVLLGGLSLMNFRLAPTLSPVVDSRGGTTPEVAYQQADFSASGSVKRPPTNFAVIKPQHGEGGHISFNRDVRPILSENCFHCHGPDAASRKAELRLDIEANAFSPHGEFAAPIIPGDAAKSPLYRRITSSLKSEIMPPLETHKSLSIAEKETIKRWINQGAKWEGHWAFIKPRKTEPVRSSWGLGPIDWFVAAKQVEQGLSPNPRADRETLARRVSLDLTGLPASPERVAAFVADSRSDAYEFFIDELLADPAYGEHQARFWLDAARYSDTHGLHLDNYREIWPYRDWVVQAFNRNQPFDEFTIEQMAGDLLPSPSQSQILATGFNRCNPTTSEGGAIDDEYQAIYAKNRAETTATVYLGLTVGCASCHDHKFDPLSQKDFYQFSAFFNNIDGPIMDGNAYDTRPNLVMPKSEYEAEWGQISTAYEKASQKLDKLKGGRDEAFKAWLDGGDFGSVDGTADRVWWQGLAVPAGPEREMQTIELPTELQEWGVADAFTFQLDLKIPVLKEGEERMVASKFDGDRGWRLFVLAGEYSEPAKYRLRIELVSSLIRGEMISMRTASRRYSPLSGGKAISVVLSYDGSGRAAGVELGAPGRLNIDREGLVDNLAGDFANPAPLVVLGPTPKPKEKIKTSPGAKAARAEIDADDDEEEEKKSPPLPQVAFFAGAKPLYWFGHLEQSEKLAGIFEQAKAERSKRDENSLKNYYLEMVDPVFSEQKRALAKLESHYDFIYDQSKVSLVMKERKEAAMAHILERGEYDKKGAEVYAAIPAVLGELAEDAPRNRLGLARWLVGKDNPLTARVTVNRIWQNLFGTGLVRTAEDFGIMGENPSHPELLDWLALEFQENGWDMKALIKQIVSSETYRQDARIEAEEYAIDPGNRFLGRGPRYRLDAEVIRDQALFVSGALHNDRGGPPVRPYQPSGIWNAVAYSGSNTRYYRQDEGAGLYRRSLYTFWKRTAPPPNMTLFDAPSRENCTVRRERTNTPLQALTLMNDPQYVEAARLLAQRVLQFEDLSTAGRIGAMYRYAFGHAASESHQKILGNSYQHFERRFQASPVDAAKLVGLNEPVPEETSAVVTQASLTMVANQIMNLDSFINKY